MDLVGGSRTCPRCVFSVDQSKSMRDQAVPGHNRWHPDIPSAASVRPGCEFRVECREWTDAQLGQQRLRQRRARRGPQRGAHAQRPDRGPGRRAGRPAGGRHPRPRPLPAAAGVRRRAGQGWGYTGIFAKANGGGFLTDHFPDAYKAIWDFHGQDATSRHIPGVRYTGITHPGLFGTAPSAELLAEWNRREQALIDTNPDRVPPLALPPLEDGVLAGTLSRAPSSTGSAARGRARSRPARTAATTTSRTSPAAAGSTTRCTCAGAKLSGGDLHFSQGDGEITFCGAIEMGGFIDFGVDLIKGGMAKYGITTNPVLIPGRVEPRYSEFLTFIGVSVDETTGENYYLDATVAYRRACLNAIEYLKKFGYSGEQAYLLLGSAPIEGRDRPAWWTSRTRAARCTCRRRSSTSTCGPTRTARCRPTAGRRRRRADRCRSTSSRARSAAGSRSAGRWRGRATGPLPDLSGARRGGSSPRPACRVLAAGCAGRCRRRRPARTSPASSGRSADGRCRTGDFADTPVGAIRALRNDRLRRR